METNVNSSVNIEIIGEGYGHANFVLIVQLYNISWNIPRVTVRCMFK